VAKTSSTPTGDVQTPSTPSDVQTPGTPSDVETPGTPTGDVQTPGPDQDVSSDPFCKKLELDKAAFGKMGDSSSSEEDDTPQQIQAASQALEQIASEAPGEIKPALEQVAKLLPKVDTDNPDETAAAQFATAMQTLIGWSVQHCGRDLFS
jgi:hypothetical protein